MKGPLEEIRKCLSAHTAMYAISLLLMHCIKNVLTCLSQFTDYILFEASVSPY